jgi:hypothetical protein
MKKWLTLSILSFALVSSVSAQTPQMIRRGNVLSWSASSGHNGLMTIVSVDGSYFEVDQSNDKNRAAGTIRLYGAVIENGHKIVLINVGQWKEVWDGEVSRDEISGQLSAGSSSYTFRITASHGPAAEAASMEPFVSGRTLKWSSDASGGQNGSLYVVATRGSTFLLEQKNDQNVAAGITKLEGEVKEGMIYIYNRKWNETWVGTFTRGAVSGKINNRYNFRISE